MNLNPHPTKKGPGRKHGHEVAHGTAPTPRRGAPAGFVLHTNPAKRQRREAIAAAGGIRQFKKQLRALA